MKEKHWLKYGLINFTLIIVSIVLTTQNKFEFHQVPNEIIMQKWAGKAIEYIKSKSFRYTRKGLFISYWAKIRSGNRSSEF